MLLKILTPFDIIEDGVSVTRYHPGEFDVTVPATIEVALRAGWAEAVESLATVEPVEPPVERSWMTSPSSV